MTDDLFPQEETDTGDEKSVTSLIFANPITLTDSDLDLIIEHYRQDRSAFVANETAGKRTTKRAASPKPKKSKTGLSADELNDLIADIDL